MPRRRPLSNISLATRLSLVALAVTLVSLSVTATVGLVRGSDLAEEVINSRLTSLASSRAQAVELYVRSVQREVAALSVSPATRDSIRELGDALRDLDADPVDADAATNVTEYYLSEIVPQLEQVGGDGVGASFLVPESPAAVSLQNAYTVPRTTSDEDDDDDDTSDGDGTEISPELVLDAGDGSAYSALHPGVHKTFGQIGIRSGYDDIFLIDARNDVVVYSLRKRIDFATSLDLGPHSGSALARVIDDLSADPSQTSRLSVMSAYVPAIESPTSFVASPVLDGDLIVGYVAIALSFERFDDVISGGGTWQTYGDAGEAYLVAGDATMVSTTRLFDESPSVFLAQASDPGPGYLDDAQRRRIATTGTTALVQPVDLELVLRAAEGPGLTSGTNYRGIDVRTAFRPLDIDGVRWTIFVEGATEELDSSIAGYARDMLFTVALFVVVVTFVAVRWSTRLVAPIRAIASRLRSARALEPTVATTGDELRARGPDEYVDLSDNVDQMLARLRARQEAMIASGRERTSLLQQFLPLAVARRSEEVGGEVLDHVHRASVVVLEAHGLGDMVGDVPEQDVRDLWGEVIDEIDGLAADQGIERVKLTGGSYYAVCGVSRPLLDHAPRAVAFALAARELVHELSDDRLTLSAGVAEGPVSVGLAAKTSLVYDIWGDTVNEAEELDRSAPGGTILVSSSVRAQLPDEFVTAGDPAGGAVAVTARLAGQEAPR